MSHMDSSTDAILAKLAAMQATLDTQQAAIVALQEENARLHAALNAEPATPSGIAPVAHDDAPEAAEEAGAHARVGLTSRRSLLRGAAAATAAASVGAVALGAAQPAHAAPLAAGDTFILGNANDAGAATSTLTSSAPTGLEVNMSGSGNSAVYASTAAVGSGTAVWGYSGQGIGIMGQTISGTAVKGVSSGGPAIWGETDSAGGTAVLGSGSVGVAGNGGVGVLATSNSNLDIHAAGTGRILQNPQSSVGVPNTFTTPCSVGESIRDVNGDLWLCVGAGSPGTWVKVLTTAAGGNTGFVTYLSKPIRLLDTRFGQPADQSNGAPYAASSTHSIFVAGVTYSGVTVPAGSTGAIGNLTVIGATGQGNYVELVPNGAGFSGTSNLNFVAGQLVSNAFNVGLANGKLDIILGSGGSADVIIDLYAVIS